jgi:hypothetical protein
VIDRQITPTRLDFDRTITGYRSFVAPSSRDRSIGKRRSRMPAYSEQSAAVARTPQRVFAHSSSCNPSASRDARATRGIHLCSDRRKRRRAAIFSLRPSAVIPLHNTLLDSRSYVRQSPHRQAGDRLGPVCAARKKSTDRYAPVGVYVRVSTDAEPCLPMV